MRQIPVITKKITPIMQNNSGDFVMYARKKGIFLLLHRKNVKKI